MSLPIGNQFNNLWVNARGGPLSKTKQPEHILVSPQPELYDSLPTFQRADHLLRDEYFTSFIEKYILVCNSS